MGLKRGTRIIFYLEIVLLITFLYTFVPFAHASSTYKGIIGMVIKPIKTFSGETVCKVRITKRDISLKKGKKVYFFSAAEKKGEGNVKFSSKGYLFVKVTSGECTPGLSVRLISEVTSEDYNEPKESSSPTTNSHRSHETSTSTKMNRVQSSYQLSSRSHQQHGAVKELPPITINYAKKVRGEYEDVRIPMNKINSGMDYYMKTLADHTVVIKFGGRKSRGGVRVNIDPMTLMNLYYTYSQYKYMSDMSSYWGGLNYPGMDTFNTLMYLGLATQLFQLFSARSKMQKSMENMTQSMLGRPANLESYIMVIYLDEHVAMARTIFYAYKETIYDEAYLKRYYRNLIDKTKVDEMAVFKVEIFNGSTVPLPLSPFAYRMYLIGANGRRYKAIKYDPQLDTNVPPRGKVSGFVYFPKYDMVTGERLVKGTVKISIEEIGPIKYKILKFH